MNNYKDYIGKTILVGLEIYNEEDELINSQQIVGTIVENIDDRIRIIPIGSDIAFHLPPDLSMLERAESGLYELENGNVPSFENPDYTVLFDIQSESREAIGPEGFVWPSEGSE